MYPLSNSTKVLLYSKKAPKKGLLLHGVWKLKEVSFTIASEASYIYILSGQKSIKNAKNSQFGEILKIWSLRSNSVSRQSILKGQKLARNAKKEIF